MFPKPNNPIGYILFTSDTKSYRGRFFHLSDLREFCKSHHIDPDDVVVFRVFHPDKSDFDRKLMDISEYAYSHTEIRYLGGLHTEVKSWSWDEQKTNEVPEITLSDVKNSLILFLHRISKWFSIFV